VENTFVTLLVKTALKSERLGRRNGARKGRRQKSCWRQVLLREAVGPLLEGRSLAPCGGRTHNSDAKCENRIEIRAVGAALESSEAFEDLAGYSTAAKHDFALGSFSEKVVPTFGSVVYFKDVISGSAPERAAYGRRIGPRVDFRAGRLRVHLLIFQAEAWKAFFEALFLSPYPGGKHVCDAIGENRAEIRAVRAAQWGAQEPAAELDEDSFFATLPLFLNSVPYFLTSEISSR
jgi:hypothetical protein